MQQPTTQDCPSLEIEADRPEPSAAMGPLNIFPNIPENFGSMTGKEQTKVLVYSWSQAAKSYGTCKLDREALVDWIKNKTIKPTE